MTEQDAEDLEVLLPDRTLTVGGEEITVREFRFGDSFRVVPLARPILADLAALRGTESNGEDLAVFEDLLARHWERILDLIAISADRPREWIERLPDQDGQTLAWTFWAVNGPFFMRRLVADELTRTSRKESGPGSSTSSTPSSQAGTGGMPGRSPSG
ncbi:hypothetical protein H0Z60_10175 [Ectothiorhodospiraceae bacterium WFHF3C12]|nr:hypothetical protein [Ectothiorhodospiraceae bacterium WFHF3C12]